MHTNSFILIQLNGNFEINYSTEYTRRPLQLGFQQTSNVYKVLIVLVKFYQEMKFQFLPEKCRNLQMRWYTKQQQMLPEYHNFVLRRHFTSKKLNLIPDKNLAYFTRQILRFVPIHYFLTINSNYTITLKIHSKTFPDFPKKLCSQLIAFLFEQILIFLYLKNDIKIHTTLNNLLRFLNILMRQNQFYWAHVSSFQYDKKQRQSKREKRSLFQRNAIV